LSLPALVVAAWRPQARNVIWISAAAFTALTVYTFIEAVMGQPFLAFIG
jgi:hypothetical protein